MTDPARGSDLWLNELTDPDQHDDAVVRLHDLLLRIARSECSRRAHTYGLHGPELDDLAHQAAADALLSITARLDDFREESRFTTWAFKFVVFEVSSKVTRHAWRRQPLQLDDEGWERLPARLGANGNGPEAVVEAREMVDAVQLAIKSVLTPHQRRVFLAVAVEGVPLDVLCERFDTNRNAIYKTMFDARRKIRAQLVTNGYLAKTPNKSDRAMSAENEGDPVVSASPPARPARAALDALLNTDARDPGCNEAFALINRYVEILHHGGDPDAALPGIGAHLRACPPCGEDLVGLLAALRAEGPS